MSWMSLITRVTLIKAYSNKWNESQMINWVGIKDINI